MRNVCHCCIEHHTSATLSSSSSSISSSQVLFEKVLKTTQCPSALRAWGGRSVMNSVFYYNNSHSVNKCPLTTMYIYRVHNQTLCHLYKSAIVLSLLRWAEFATIQRGSWNVFLTKANRLDGATACHRVLKRTSSSPTYTVVDRSINGHFLAFRRHNYRVSDRFSSDTQNRQVLYTPIT